MPGGAPKYVRVYDNGGETADRYTVVYSKRSNKTHGERYYDFRAMSANPFDPCGVGLWGETRHYPVDSDRGKWPPAMGRTCHLGKRIPFADLPEPCQRLVIQDYRELWNINTDRP